MGRCSAASGIFLGPGIKPMSSPALAGGFFQRTIREVLLLQFMSKKSCLFSSRSFMVLVLHVGLIHFELTFCRWH